MFNLYNHLLWDNCSITSENVENMYYITAIFMNSCHSNQNTNLQTLLLITKYFHLKEKSEMLLLYQS